MEKPKIKINEKEIEMGKIKACWWKDIMKFHEERQNIENQDLMEKYGEIIALAFGVKLDEVLENFGVEDIVPTYLDVFRAVVALLTEKVGKKNAEAGEEI